MSSPASPALPASIEAPLSDPARLRWLLLACIAAYTFANVPLWLLPVILSDSMAALHLSATQSGVVVSGETLGLGGVSIALAAHSFGMRYRTLALIGAAIALVGNVASGFATDFDTLLGARLVAGAGEGAVLMVATALVADFADPERAYGILNIVNIVYGSAVFMLMPWLWPERSGLQVFLIGALAMLPLVALLFQLSRRTAAVHHHVAAQGGSFGVLSAPAVLLYLCMLCVGSSSGGTWAFLAEYGKQTGLAEEAVVSAIGVATLAAILGSVLVSVVGSRWGRLVPLLLGMLVTGAANWLLTQVSSPLAFRIESAVTLISIYFLLPGLLAYGAFLDRTGRISTVVGGVFMLTIAVGPTLFGWVVDHHGMAGLATTVLLLCGSALALLLGLHRGVSQRLMLLESV